MASTRREFLRNASCAALGAAAMATNFGRFRLVNALTQQTQAAATDYKALVCIFLSGGNDGNNTIIPYDNYAVYNSVRGASQLAIAQSSLLQITPPSGGATFGFHPSLSPEVATPGQPTGLLPLWQQGKLAVLCNVGPLVEPLTRTSYQNGTGRRPYQLFSHSDQVAQWQSSVSNAPAQTGWGGRTADSTSGLNGNAGFPSIVSIAGISLYVTGKNTRPLAVADSGTPLNRVLAVDGYDGSAIANARYSAYRQLLTVDNDAALVKSASDTTTKALDASQLLSTDPTLATVFPNTSLGRQLKQVAKIIKVNTTGLGLGLSRQMFFCSLGGFDTHNGQVNQQLNLLAQLSQAMKAFYDATIELGIASQVTTFTLADFGRTLQPAGSGAASVGSDHAWGNHHFIMGGAVRGGDFYGTRGPNNTLYPTLALGGPDDTDTRGRWIPTTAVDQYAATLAQWYGLSSSDLPAVFPNLNRFATSNLGFLM